MGKLDDKLSELMQRASAASPGPLRVGWRHLSAPNADDESYVVVEAHEGFAGEDFHSDWVIAVTSRYKRGHDNACFFADARTTVPRLVKALQACIRQRDALDYADAAESGQDADASEMNAELLAILEGEDG